MNLDRFDRFSQPQFLQRIGRERVTSLLMRFAPELLTHGILMPALALPDEVFFTVLATLPRQRAALSAELREAMTAIEVIEEVYPDEVPAAPSHLEVSEIRLRLANKARPVLLTAAGNHGLVDYGITGLVGVAALGEPGTAREPHDLILTRASTPSPRPAEPRPGNFPAPASEEPARTKVAARFKFVRKGNVYVVRFDGMPKFHLTVTDGTRYAEVLLHEPNVLLHSLELERRVKPDKAAAREVNSIQKAMDAQALRALRTKLQELQADMAEAESQGAMEWAAQLEGEIGVIKKCLVKNVSLGSDSGERARNNVRKAIGKLVAKLRKGGPAEQAFGRHLDECISLGYEVMYVQPLGRVWE